MKFTLRFSTPAAKDIEIVLAQTLANFGEEKCEQYKLLMRVALDDIAADPFAHPSRAVPGMRPDARVFHLSRRGKRASHFFAYRVIADNFVEISRLLHDSMDLAKHLPPGFGASENS